MNCKILTTIFVILISFNLLAESPIVDLPVGSHVLAGDRYQLDASGSYDPDGDDITFKWRILNAPAGSDAELLDNFDGTAEFVSDRVGSYGFELTVQDMSGENTIEHFSISASQSTGNILYGPVNYDTSIVCKATFGLFGCNSQVYNFSQPNPVGSYSLVVTVIDIDKVIMRLNGEQISFYSETTGQGQETFIKEVYLEIDNELVIEASGGFSGNVAIQVQENTLMSDLNTAPILEDKTLNIPFYGQDHSLVLDAMDLNNNDVLFYEIISTPYRGTAYLTGNTLFYRPEDDYIGRDEVLVRVYDSGIPSKQTIAKIEVLVTNEFPPMLSIADFTGNTEVMTNYLSVMNTSPVTASISRQGSNGVATLDPITNIVTYTPNSGFVGNDNFDILGVSDSNFNLETTITVNVIISPNTPPVFGDLNLAVKPNFPIEFELPLADPVEASQQIISYNLEQTGSSGTVEHMFGRFYRYTPNTDFEGTDTIIFSATDSGNSTNITSNVVTVDVDLSANTPPSIGSGNISHLKTWGGLPASVNIRLEDLPTDTDGVITKIMWNFGDGNQREIDLSYQNADIRGSIYHYYENAGVYSVTATVFDDNGASTSTTRQITVTDTNIASVRVVVDNYEGPSPLNVNFNAALTTDNGETPDNQLYFIWNFRDGSPIQEGVGLNNVNHTYTTAGTYYPYVLVRDGESSNYRIFTITVDGSGPAPIPQAMFTKSIGYGDAPLTVSFSGENSIDATGNALGLTYKWNMKDQISGESFKSGKNVSHTFNSPGTYYVELTVIDSNNISNTYGEFVHVKNPDYNEYRFFIFDQNGLTVDLQLEEIYIITPATDASYFIDWGDGQKEITHNRYPYHTYAADGTYNITVKAELIAGEEKSFTQKIVLNSNTKFPSFEIDSDTYEGLIPFQSNHEIVDFDFDPNQSNIIWHFAVDGIFESLALNSMMHTQDHSVQGVHIKRTYVTNEYGLTRVHFADINKFVDKKPSLRLNANSCVGKAPFTINFDATGSSDLDGLKSFQWHTDYNDQEFYYTDLQFSHTFTVAENITASAFLKDNSGDLRNDYPRYLIYDSDVPVGNLDPTVIADHGFWDPQSPKQFTVSTYESTDDGEIICFKYDMGDGTTFIDSHHVDYTYSQPGDYTVTVIAIDNWGSEGSTSFDITVPSVVTTSSSTAIPFRPTLNYSNEIRKKNKSSKEIFEELMEEYLSNRKKNKDI